MKKTSLLVLLLFFHCIFLKAQNAKIDSLTTLLKNEKVDTSKVNLLNQIAIENITIGNFDTVPYYANKAISIANKSSWKKGLAEANNMLRSAYFNKADYDEALKYATISLQLFKEINDENGVAGILSNIGGIYWNRGEYPRALENMLEALKIYEKNKNKKGIAKVNGNIGLVYFDQNEPEKSLTYFFKALQLDKELKNKNGISRHLSNIGNIYFQKYEFNKSLQYYFEALKINEELNNVNSKGINLGNIGNVYVEINQPDTALKYLFKAIEINRSTGNKGNIARDLSNIGTAYLKLKNYTLAESYLKEALKITHEIESLDYVRRFELALSDVYLAKGDYKNAYAHFKLYSNAKDSIFNEEKHKDITKKEMNYEYEKKELATKAENDKKAALAAETNKRQKIIIWSVVFGLVLVAVILIIVFRSLQITKSQKQVIEKQKEEVVKQKEIIQEHQKEILDSITYAKRIQEAILPPQKLVKQYLEESFILYKPKDIVAGDFYWLEAKNDLVLFAAADCTGHGVPGAMVSVVCSNALNRTVKEFAITEPGKILDKVKELVQETFEKSESEVKDGMDVSLCALNLSTKTLHWSGANNPLWIIRNNELIEYAPDKQPIGKTDFGKNFSTHQIELQKNDSIYIFTDGYVDQFGGMKGKKFKSANFKNLLLSIVNEPMTEQRNRINNAFESWRGELEQVDDVCVIGVRV